METKMTPEEKAELGDKINHLEDRIWRRLPKNDAKLEDIWWNVFQQLAERIELVPDAPGDIRQQGTRDDRLLMLWWLRPRSIVDGELVVEILPQDQELTVPFAACLPGLKIQIENVLERLALVDGLEPLTVVFKQRTDLRAVTPA